MTQYLYVKVQTGINSCNYYQINFESLDPFSFFFTLPSQLFHLDYIHLDTVKLFIWISKFDLYGSWNDRLFTFRSFIWQKFNFLWNYTQKPKSQSTRAQFVNFSHIHRICFVCQGGDMKHMIASAMYWRSEHILHWQTVKLSNYQILKCSSKSLFQSFFCTILIIFFVNIFK